LAARIWLGAAASGSGGLADLDGAGGTGGSIGTTTTQCLTTVGITPGAERFTTEAVLPEEQAHAAELTTAQLPGLSTETSRRLGDTLNPAVSAASAPAPSADTAMADRLRAFPRAEAPVWARVAEEDLVAVAAAVAGVGNGSCAVFLVACKILKRREPCGERS